MLRVLLNHLIIYISLGETACFINKLYYFDSLMQASKSTTSSIITNILINHYIQFAYSILSSLPASLFFTSVFTLVDALYLNASYGGKA